MRKILLVLWFMMLTCLAIAQDRTVTGRVVSTEDGTAIPGVSVVVKGTATGTVTDSEGRYSLTTSSGSTLVFSFIGLQSQEVIVGDQAVIDISLAADATQLSEVVVTAIGVERNAKEVAYANQTVTNKDLLSTPNKNTLEALRGKTAGVRLSTGSGSVGASTRIVLRGEGSLTGNNNALIVVDGIPINNESTAGGAGASTTGYADFGNRFNDLNPDDIESVTILKGPSATSLYGSRGASGVVLITTKKGGGRDGKLQIGINSSYSVEKAYILMQRQGRFGQGFANAFDSGENFSWGPKFDGEVRPWTSPIDADGDGDLEALSRPFSNVPDQLQDFFDLGSTLSNAISLSGANKNSTYYLSYSNTDQKGILQNTRYKRNTVTLNVSSKLSDKLRSDFKVSYAAIDQNTAQEGSRPFEGNNAYAMVLQSPTNIPFSEQRDYKNPFHDIDGYWGSYSSVNPYFILNEHGNRGRINNFLGNTSVTYSIIDGLEITGRFGANVINTTVDTWTPKYTPAEQLVWLDNLQLATRNTKNVSIGDYSNYLKTNMNLDMSVLATYTRKINEDFKLDFSGGYNWFQTEREDVTGTTAGGLVVEDVYNLSNSVQNARSFEFKSKYRIYGVLANARLGWKDALFLELSARNDWSSTLPEENNSFGYSAVGVSAILNELFPIESDILSFAKLRTSYGTTGKDAGLYLLESYYVGNPTIVANLLYFPLEGQAGFTTGDQIGNPALKPEKTTTFEVGADLGFFNERVNLSYTYYNSQHADQIVQISLPASSGYTGTVSNIGLMTNKGHEITLNLKPIDGLVKDLKMELFATYAKNVNEVVKITDDINELVIGGPYTGVSIVAKKGMPFGTYKAIGTLRNEDGQIIVDENTGLPKRTPQEQYFGSYQPDFMASFGANLSYKGIGFNILIDVKKGGNFISQTKSNTEFNGTAVHTDDYNRQPYIFPNSVIDNGDGTYRANDVLTNEYEYYSSYRPAGSTNIIDASYVKLREIGLSYTVPRSILERTPFKTARFAVFGKNLKFWLPEENTYADPEVNGPALIGNAQGVETSQTPPSKSFGASLQLTF